MRFIICCCCFLFTKNSRFVIFIFEDFLARDDMTITVTITQHLYPLYPLSQAPCSRADHSYLLFCETLFFC